MPVAQHLLLGPGEVSVADANYPAPAPTGLRPLRPRTASEQAFLRRGAEAEAYLHSVVCSGAAGLSERIEEALAIAASCGPSAPSATVATTTAISRRSASSSVPPRPNWPLPCPPLELAGLPEIVARPIRLRERGGRRVSAPLEAELEASPRRLKLRRIRELAPELLQTARTQRWRPEELLGTLVREEITAREASNLARRIKAARFPAPKTLKGFDPAASELAPETFSSLGLLEWLERNENLCLAAPAGTGKSHLSTALGRAACDAGKRGRFLLADELHRGLADNSVGKLITTLLRDELVVIDDLG